MIRRFQAEWMHLFQVYCHNDAANVNQNTQYPKMPTPYLPRTDILVKYKEGLFLPNFIINDEFFLQNFDQPCEPRVQETYTTTTTVRKRITFSNDVIVSGSRTIIDDVLMLYNVPATLLPLFECGNQVFLKYRVSTKITKCDMFSEKFEYIGRDVLQAKNTTANYKYNLIKDWKQPEIGDDLRSFVSFCNLYTRFIPMFEIQYKSICDLYTRCGKGKIPASAWTQNLSGIFNSLKHSIVSFPLVARFDSSKPLFPETD